MRKIFFVIVLLVVIGFGYYTYETQFNQPERDVRDKAALRAVIGIVDAQEQYEDRYGRYAKQLYELGPPLQAGRGPSEMGANLIPRDIATGRKLSYTFRLRGYGDSYSVNADPYPSAESEGAPLRHFFADETGAIRYNEGQPATAGSPPVD